jgi:hypothetical protein
MMLRHILKPDFKNKMEETRKEWEKHLCLFWESKHPATKPQ